MLKKSDKHSSLGLLIESFIYLTRTRLQTASVIIIVTAQEKSRIMLGLGHPTHRKNQMLRPILQESSIDVAIIISLYYVVDVA